MLRNCLRKILLTFCCVLLVCSWAQAKENLLMKNFDDFSQNTWDLSTYFEGMQGCAVLLNPGKLSFSLYNMPMAKERFSPFSSFKIVSALLGLEYGVVQDKMSKMHYNGTTYWLDAWNKDLTFKQAFQSSAVWYFRQLIDKIPMITMKNDLQKLGYGNADVSAWQGNGSNKKPELNGFWLNSSLRISPYEQTMVMYNVFSMGSRFNKAHTELIESFMQVNHGSIYGKTGSDGRGQSWFVGFIKNGAFKDYFAFYVQGAKDSAPHAKNIALKVLENY